MERDAEPQDQGAAEQAEQMEDRAERMDERSDEVEREIEEAGSDWESKKHDRTVPGAQTEEGATDRASDGDGEEGGSED